MDNPDKHAPTRARAALTAGGAAVGALVAWLRWGGPWLAVLLAVMLGLFIIAIASPRSYAPVQRVLDSVVQALLRAISWTLLGLVFAGVFVPGRLLLLLRGRRALERGRDTSASGYWRPVPKPREGAVRFTSQF